MKTLLLVRHAKSEAAEHGLPDHERGLNDRGRHDAPEMGRRLKQRGLVPDAILSSTAVRARTTAQMMAGELDFDVARIVLDRRLYGASPEKLVGIIRALDDGLSCLMLVGHNPELTDLAHRFSEAITDMPTCAIAGFRFDATAWQEVRAEDAASVLYDHPGRAPS